MQKRSITILSLILAWIWASVVLAGSVEDRGDKTVIHVKVWTLPDPSNPDTFNRAEVAGVEAFKRRFPEIFAKKYRDKYMANPEKYGRHNWDNVEIELHKFSGIKVEGVETDLLAIAGGLAPDVLYVNFRKSDNYIRNNFLYPLDKPEDGYFTSMSSEEIRLRINPKLWPVIKRRGPDGRKHIWSMPYGGALGKVLLYRKDLFEGNNIPFPTDKWTWKDMLDAAKKLTNYKKGIYGLRLGRGKHESWHWMTFLWSAGGEAMVYNEKTDEWRCAFDSREAAVALDFYNQLSAEKWIDEEGKVRRGYSTKDASESSAKWERGQIGMMFSYIDETLFSKINPEVTGMAPVPLGFSGKRGAELNSRMFGLFSGIKEPAVRDAAWEYIRFYDCKEAKAIKTRIMVEGGLGPFVNPKYLRMFGYEDVIRLSPRGWARNFEIAIATGKPEPFGKNSNYAYNMMTYPIQEVEQITLNDKLPKDREARLKLIQGILKKWCDKANEEMIGIITPQERTKRRVAAVLFLIAMVVGFGYVFRRIVKTFTPPAEFGKEKKSWDFGRYMWAYILLVPSLTTILVWRYYPLLQGSAMAFYDYRLIGKSTLVWVDNFGDLLFDHYWWKAVYNSLRYSFLVIFLTFLPPIVLAILLQEVPRGKILFRTIYYLPAVITGLVTTVMWKQFYDPSENGALNSILLSIPPFGFVGIGVVLFTICVLFAYRLWYHEIRWPAVLFAIGGVILFCTCASLALPMLFLEGESWTTSLAQILWHHPWERLVTARVPEPYRWLSDPDTAMLACVIPMVWAGMGPGCLIYLAALKGIPDDYYEAADIDGANFIDKILFVIFPMLKALVIINFVGVFIRSWYGATGNIMVMTGGGAETETVGLHIWYKAFTFLKFGPATAMAWMLGFMLIGFTVHQLRILSRVEFRATGNKEK